MFSFSKRKNVVEATNKVRKLIDLTTPNRPSANDARCAQRYNRCVPVFVADWDKDSRSAILENAGVGFTTDISDTGFSVLTQFCPTVHDNVVGIYLPRMGMLKPWFFHVEYAGYRTEPQGFIRVGYQIVEFLTDNCPEACNRMTRPLVDTLELEPTAQA